VYMEGCGRKEIRYKNTFGCMAWVLHVSFRHYLGFSLVLDRRSRLRPGREGSK